jgi:hypothetical protein
MTPAQRLSDQGMTICPFHSKTTAQAVTLFCRERLQTPGQVLYSVSVIPDAVH